METAVAMERLTAGGRAGEVLLKRVKTGWVRGVEKDDAVEESWEERMYDQTWKERA